MVSENEQDENEQDEDEQDEDEQDSSSEDEDYEYEDMEDMEVTEELETDTQILSRPIWKVFFFFFNSHLFSYFITSISSYS